MKKLIFFCFLSISFSSLTSAQMPAIQWQNTIGGTLGDEIRAVQQTADGGYILGGSSYSDANGDKSENSLGGWDYWVVKLNSTGTIVWDNTIGGNSSEHLQSIHQTSDGGYILGGYSMSGAGGDKTENGYGGQDYWVVKLDALGAVVWENTIGGDVHDELYSVQETSDGGFILGGSSNSNAVNDKTEGSIGSYDYWIIKLNAFGSILWQKVIGGNDFDELWRVMPAGDGGFFAAGSSASSFSGDKDQNSFGAFDYWVIKIDSIGTIEWQKNIGGSGTDFVRSMDVTDDGGIIVGGFSDSNASGNKTESSNGGRDYWVVRLDSAGTIAWQNTIGGNDWDELYAVKQTEDGGYFLTGTSYSNASGDKTENRLGSWDYWVVKLNALGAVTWENTIGGNNEDKAYAGLQTMDEGFFLAGTSASNTSIDKTEDNVGDYDNWVIKLGSECGALPEICNGMDDNCDGLVDNVTVCPKPTGLSTSGITSSTATLNWTALPCATSYRVRYRSQISPGVWSGYTTWVATGLQTSKTFTNLTQAKYEWQVQAKCGSLYSAAAQGSFSTCQTCEQAMGLTATNITASSATVNWTTFSLPCVKRFRFRYRYRTTGTSWSSWSSYTYTTSTNAGLTGLVSGKLHQWQVSVECVTGWSAISTGTFTTPVSAMQAPGNSAIVAAGIHVFPNPSSSGKFTLDLPDCVIKMQVCDLFGKVLLLPPISERELNLSDLPSGIYFLQVTRNDGIVATLKIIKEQV